MFQSGDTQTYINTYIRELCMYVYIYTHTCVCVYIYVYTCTYTYIRIPSMFHSGDTHICCVYMLIHIHTYMCCVFMHTYICTWVPIMYHSGVTYASIHACIHANIRMPYMYAFTNIHTREGMHTHIFMRIDAHTHTYTHKIYTYMYVWYVQNIMYDIHRQTVIICPSQHQSTQPQNAKKSTTKDYLCH